MAGDVRRFRLTAEDRDDVVSPDAQDIAETVDALCPSYRCGFLCLEEDRPDGWGDYVQAAGGRDVRTGRSRFTVERRIYVRDEDDEPDLRRPHRHLVAGLAGRSEGRAHIETNGYRVTVQRNEVLSRHHVIEILTAFLASRDLPAAYRWRSNREEVEDIVRDSKARGRWH